MGKRNRRMGRNEEDGEEGRKRGKRIGDQVSGPRAECCAAHPPNTVQYYFEGYVFRYYSRFSP